MKTETIDGHTFCPELLSNGWVIDAGCRGWNFSNRFNKVLALDIEPMVPPEHVSFFHAALSAKLGSKTAYFFGNGTGNFVEGINEVPGDLPDRPMVMQEVNCITLQEIYSIIGQEIDLLKLDIEGSEYEVLAEIEPIPKQITVEFHEHCHLNIHNRYINEVMTRLGRWYNIKMIIDPQWPQYKFQDVLFIRKDIL